MLKWGMCAQCRNLILEEKEVPTVYDSNVLEIRFNRLFDNRESELLIFIFVSKIKLPHRIECILFFCVN